MKSKSGFKRTFFSIGILLLFWSFVYCQPIKLLTPPPGGTSTKPVVITSPIKVTWKIVDSSTDELMVVQVYRDGALIFPPDSMAHEMSENGVQIPLNPYIYEVKVWRPNTEINTSTWIRIKRASKKVGK